MAQLRIPQNQVVTSKYTAGNEYMFKETQREYQGYYYELNGKILAGKEINVSSPELIKIEPSNINSLLTNASTYVYGKISGIVLNNIKVSSIVHNGESGTRYFVGKEENGGNLIKEVTKENFQQIGISYQKATLQFNALTGFNDKEIEEANKVVIGIKEFLQSLNYNPINDSDEGMYPEEDQQGIRKN